MRYEINFKIHQLITLFFLSSSQGSSLFRQFIPLSVCHQSFMTRIYYFICLHITGSIKCSEVYKFSTMKCVMLCLSYPTCSVFRVPVIKVPPQLAWHEIYSRHNCLRNINLEWAWLQSSHAQERIITESESQATSLFIKICILLLTGCTQEWEDSHSVE